MSTSIIESACDMHARCTSISTHLCLPLLLRGEYVSLLLASVAPSP